MRLTRVEFSIRTPTVQYGYIEGKYILEAEDDNPEEIEHQIQFYMAMQEHALKKYDESESYRKKYASKRTDAEMPFN